MTEETSLIKEDFYENEAIFNYCNNFYWLKLLSFLVTKLFKHILKTSKQRANYDKLQQKFQMPMSKHQEHVRPQFESLEKINKDIVGWIKLSGTSLNYPILQAKSRLFKFDIFQRYIRRKGASLWILQMNPRI